MAVREGPSPARAAKPARSPWPTPAAGHRAVIKPAPLCRAAPGFDLDDFAVDTLTAL
ncbi:hypothetical protein [Nonomuraea africana]|uniref:Uncharacterized protein n=1 Tax=Nonomuraea africana TaxID=46171 RepID=A0ABR9KPN6_9ACTN|nr:hypothetical protein [Nonomuraea africana]MBE1564003.1 hypothetical protein [Nonomuraea africana]